MGPRTAGFKTCLRDIYNFEHNYGHGKKNFGRSPDEMVSLLIADHRAKTRSDTLLEGQPGHLEYQKRRFLFVLGEVPTAVSDYRIPGQRRQTFYLVHAVR